MQQKDTLKDETTSAATRVAGAIGKGIVAGLIGTAIMTIAQKIEMQASGRKSSTMPYKVAKKLFGVVAQDDESKKTVSNLMHLLYGTAWGIPRALIAEFGTGGIAGTVAHFGAVWGTEITLMPSLKVMKPVTDWKPKAISEDVLFHSVYALATGLAADALTRPDEEEDEV